MRRLIGIAGALALALVLLAPVADAADPLGHTGRVVMTAEGDFTLPAGEQADAVVVIRGAATIQGQANTIVVVDGRLDLTGGTAETVFAIRSPVEIGPDGVVRGDVMTFDSLVHQTGNAEVGGEVTDLATMLVGLGLVLAPALLLLWIGVGLATVAAGLLLAGLAARQIRDAERTISAEPVLTLVTGIVAVILFPVMAILSILTIVGAPLGIGILLGAWPFVAFIGFLVAGIWVGDWVVRRLMPERVQERPYLAAVVGLLILQAIAIVPVLAVVPAVASLFGFGAVTLLALRTLRSHGASQPTVPGSMRAPVPG